MTNKITVAAAHLAPVYLDAQATVDKACAYIHKAAVEGVQLIAFPESFVPGFPLWPALTAPIYNHDLFKRFAGQSLRVPGPEIVKICTAARDTGMIVSIGISESAEHSVGCIWNTNLLIGGDGGILNHHRKLVPTFYEKLIWANGDGAGLRVVDTPIGRVGALICGENTNPLARYSLMAQGEQLHISSYPPVWPTHDPAANDRYDLASAIRIRAGAHSFEAKVFNIVAAARLDQSAFDAMAGLDEEALRVMKESPKGVSMILGPSGLPVAEISADEDQLLIERIDLSDCVVPKQFHDVTGYYNRFDVFGFSVDRRERAPATFEDPAEAPRAMNYEDMESLATEGVRRVS
ncbi:MAG: aliphatic nitrilase [Rhodospirillales bacterium CG15_BIG_FIL_POST_REV_8_21_14_020_66_15]|nr:MAG: aliphatic nitrilase [Rhodospirillales bacterium CG15_BIG_FIL_POST_REV_8_21_14_020_66_15]